MKRTSSSTRVDAIIRLGLPRSVRNAAARIPKADPPKNAASVGHYLKSRDIAAGTYKDPIINEPVVLGGEGEHDDGA